MTMFQPVNIAADRVLATLIAGLELEFGRGAGKALAARFVAAEECDFVWEARQQERWLGVYETNDEGEDDLDRIAILGRLNGRWYVATCIVDGDGCARGMIGRRDFASVAAARMAFVAQR